MMYTFDGVSLEGSYYLINYPQRIFNFTYNPNDTTLKEEGRSQVYHLLNE